MSDLLAHLQAIKVDLNREDRQVWKVGSGGEFSVKFCYGYISLAIHYDGPWREIWVKGVPLKIQFFMWTIMLEKISTMDSL